MALILRSPVDIQKNELLRHRVHNTTQAAATTDGAVTGQLIYDTGTNRLYYYNGTSWIAADGQTATGLSDNAATTIQPDDAAAAGTGTAASRDDHKHAIVAAAAGASAAGDAAAEGTSTSFARADHTHGREAFGAVTAQTSFGAASANGTATSIARSDHTHGTPAHGTSQHVVGTDINAAPPAASAVADTQAEGVATSVARSDHRHAREAFGTVTAQTTFGAASANGSATTVARSDHTHGTPTHDTAAHSAVAISGLAAPTADVAWGSFKITGLADPTNAQDAATKAYVDAARAGLDVKDSVRAATTANITLSGTQTIDGVTLSAGNRVLVKNQTTTSQNGIYTVAAGAWSRATDADVSAEVTPGMFIFVEEGTAQADTGWVLTTDAPITLGTTGLTFTQFSGPGTITYGSPSASAVGDVSSDGSGTAVARANHVHAREGFGAPAASAVGDTSSNGVATTVSRSDHRHARESFGAVTAVAYGDASANGVATAVARSDHNHGLPSTLTRKYAADIGDGSTTSIVVTHNLGTRDVMVVVRDNTTPYAAFLVEWQATSVNTVTLVFAIAPTTAQFRAVVVA